MKSRFSRALFWLSMAGYLAVSIWWLIHVPRAPGHLLRAIPGHASLVSLHDRPAPRWAEVSGHPLVVMLAGVSGVDAGEWAATRNDPGLRALLDLVGRDLLAAGYVPHLNFHQEGAWVFSSWLGGRSQRLRWSAPYLDIPGLEPAGVIGGWPVWTWSWETEQGPRQLSLALVEGMLLGTTARDPHAMRMILDTYNGGFPSIASRKDLADQRWRLLMADAPDRLWYKQTTWSKTTHWFFDLDVRGADRVAITALVGRPGFLTGLPSALDHADLAGLWGDAPMASAVLALESARGWLNQFREQSWSVLPREALAQPEAGAVALGLFGGDFSGRFRGIKVPVLMAALWMPEETDAAAMITRTIDGWNARYRLGLLPVPYAVGPRRVWRIEGIADGIYASLVPAEQVALTTAGRWLVISSNAKALETLIQTEWPEDGGSRRWVNQLRDAASAEIVGGLGFDLARGGEAIRLAITAYTLKLVFEDAAGTREQRQMLNDAKGWLDLLTPWDHLTLMVSAEGEHLKIDLTAGPSNTRAP